MDKGASEKVFTTLSHDEYSNFKHFRIFIVCDKTRGWHRPNFSGANTEMLT